MLQYLDLLSTLTKGGSSTAGSGRTGRFAVQHRYDLRHCFPLMTCVRNEWQGKKASRCCCSWSQSMGMITMLGPAL